VHIIGEDESLYMTDSQEKAIISEILDGQHDQYRPIVERYQRGLIQHLYSLIHDEQQAEDIAQDAFIRAYDKLYQYDQTYAFSTWLYKIADNMAYRALKRGKPTMNFDTIADVLPDSKSTMVEKLDASFNSHTVRNAVDTLPRHYRQVISLYYCDNFDYENIAVIMDRPVGTIRTWLHRAKEQLRKELYGKI
jgi:RNA polymerase sigma-70 factor (ECF subfamily)